MENKKEYSNGEVTIVWKQHLCQHSGNCVRGLPSVFRPKVQPWIEARGASSDEIVEQVKKCPSGALSYYYNKDKDGH
nr:(4Fe-4S)-binding protein [uncultured Flavobacterium sp.]